MSSSQLLPQRPLGKSSLVCSAQGLGCMGMTAFYGTSYDAASEEAHIETIGKALSVGLNFLDTAWIYQSFGRGGANFTNEELVGKALARFGREKFIVATKTGIAFIPGQGLAPNGSEEAIRSQLADSLKRLNTTYIDLYYIHRVDSTRPIEETFTVMKKLIDEGVVKAVGISECTPAELRRAASVCPIAAIQLEWSLQTRDAEAELIPTARELGIAIVPYSPLGRGFLSKTFTKFEDLAEDDWRRTQPRFSPETLAKNAEALEKYFAFAERKGCTPAQLALAWLHAQGDDIFPIPGTKSSSRIVENTGAFFVKLTSEEVAEVASYVPAPEGDRYDANTIKATWQQRL